MSHESFCEAAGCIFVTCASSSSSRGSCSCNLAATAVGSVPVHDGHHADTFSAAHSNVCHGGHINLLIALYIMLCNSLCWQLQLTWLSGSLLGIKTAIACHTVTCAPDMTFAAMFACCKLLCDVAIVNSPLSQSMVSVPHQTCGGKPSLCAYVLGP